MNRRTFLSALAGGLLAAPLAAEAQPRSRVARVAFLDGGNLESHLWQATRDGLRGLGYVEGQNLAPRGPGGQEPAEGRLDDRAAATLSSSR